MAIIDLTLNNFLIPNFPSLSPSFGTKKTKNDEGLSSVEIHHNIAMAFQRQRPVVVSENSETTEIGADATLVFNGTVSEVSLGSGTFMGCRLILINNTGHKVTVHSSDEIKYIYRDTMTELFWYGSWVSLVKTNVGNIVHTSISDEAELARRRYLKLDGKCIPVSDYEELVDTVWRGSETNDAVQAFFKCDGDGTKNAAGDHFKLPNVMGKVLRAAGKGDPIPDRLGAPSTNRYDGKEIGDSITDAIRNLYGSISFKPDSGNSPSGAFYAAGEGNCSGDSGPKYVRYVNFDVSRIVPTAPWNRDASVSANVCIIY
ncbi:hypothetical protein [Breznakiella homolactica]|uniref:Uncharacterized protein n=1 Tax=Breznakiella homolactica TaxID=2798577 RepID=A0A7T7XPI4_9SPIR|nr:hypothetical protein [Breznakiella homolactica]QQO10103.1 hypothetical protein JFL75_04070 [Breznakiella homolactica]